MLLLSSASFGLVAAFVVSWAVDPTSDWGGTLACVLVIVIAFALASSTVAGDPTPAVRAFGLGFATLGGVAAASAVSVGAIRVSAEDAGFGVFVPMVVAAAVALLLEASASRWAGTRFNRPGVFAAWGAAAVLAVTAVVLGLITRIDFLNWLRRRGQ